MYKPRYCGLCSDGRCCTPHNTKTIQVEFRCPQGKFLKKPMMLINTCVCHSNCPQSNNAFFQQLDPASSEAKIWNAWFVLPKRYVVHTKLDPQSGECNNCICKISKIFFKTKCFCFSCSLLNTSFDISPSPNVFYSLEGNCTLDRAFFFS